IESLPTAPANPAQVISGRNISDAAFDLEYALPNKNSYLYKVSLVVTDEHELEQAFTIREINLPHPNALIMLARPLQELRPQTPGQNALYRFEGRAALSSLYGNIRYDWMLANRNGWAVGNQGPNDRDTFNFDFEY